MPKTRPSISREEREGGEGKLPGLERSFRAWPRLSPSDPGRWPGLRLERVVGAEAELDIRLTQSRSDAGEISQLRSGW
jgi:hypothetical protein